MSDPVILLVAYLGGVLTILSPCVLPVLPFVFARADRPFRSHGLPMLAGMAVAFAAVATLAAVGGNWVVELNQYGRYAAIAMLAVFGLTMLVPSLADRLSQPFVALGSRLAVSASGSHPARMRALSPLLLGAGTGMLWAPCAGPILGLILTTAALNGASAGTSLLLLVYAAGACTSLAAALLFGRRIFSMMKGTLAAGVMVRRVAGAAVLVGVGTIALGIDTDVLSRISFGSTTALEKSLVERIDMKRPGAPGSAIGPDKTELVRTATTTPAPAPAPPLRQLASEGAFPSLAGATGWINSAPLSADALRGKVVLVDFWTYSCINCLRTVPYLRAWAQKYKDAGLVIVGVHTPEFAFEKRTSNVVRATKDLGIDFPVALDNDFAVWRAFRNRAWPAFYFIDAQGQIRHHQFGENQYEEAEEVIQQLLSEAGWSPVPSKFVAPQGVGTQAAASRLPALSQEAYLGHERTHNFASPGGIARDRAGDYQLAAALRTDQWSLGGNWTVEGERAVVNLAGGRLAYRFHARDLHLVLGPSADGKSVRFKVRVDGKAPLADHGFDTDPEGNGTIDGERLYQLVRQSTGGKSRLFEIEFLDPGAHAYAFTFG